MKSSLRSSICFFITAIIWSILFCSKLYEHNNIGAIIYGLAAIVSLFTAIMHSVKYRKCKWFEEVERELWSCFYKILLYKYEQMFYTKKGSKNPFFILCDDSPPEN